MGISQMLLLSILILLCTASCNTVDPPDKAVLALTLEDVSCTEAWITLTTNNLQLPATLNLLKDNTITKTINLQTADTLLYIDSLLPNQTYNYQVSGIGNPVSVILSNELSVTTLDTTSHNFTWQTWTFGEHGNSVLYDVAIINENCIWAVGEIYMKDSLGNPDNNAYNAVHWDESQWELMRIPYYYQGQPFNHPIQAVFAFGSNDIWFCGNGVIHWDGNNFNPMPIPSIVWGPYQMNKIWGSNSNDLYVVGDAGNIAHWNGSNWTKIESGTDVNLRDISGQGDEILINGYSLDYRKSVLLKLNNNNIEVVWENNSLSGTSPYGSLVFANKVLNNNLFVASSNGVYQDKLKIKHPRKQLFFSSRAIYRVVGSGINDLSTVGDRSTVWHYNGLTSREVYSKPDIPSPFYSADSKDNLFAAVGLRVENVIHHKATILIGRR